ncbi:MAG: hypothetical protein Kow00105_18390 [Phycisphaeraceae bacterium]
MPAKALVPNLHKEVVSVAARRVWEVAAILWVNRFRQDHTPHEPNKTSSRERGGSSPVGRQRVIYPPDKLRSSLIVLSQKHETRQNVQSQKIASPGDIINW